MRLTKCSHRMIPCCWIIQWFHSVCQLTSDERIILPEANSIYLYCGMSVLKLLVRPWWNSADSWPTFNNTSNWSMKWATSGSLVTHLSNAAGFPVSPVATPLQVHLTVHVPDLKQWQNMFSAHLVVSTVNLPSGNSLAVPGWMSDEASSISRKWIDTLLVQSYPSIMRN
jgi:hypothetical protein